MDGTWLQRIEDARKPFMRWEKEGDRIVNKYRAKRTEDGQGSSLGRSEDHRATRYNALFANVESLQPALFTRAPSVIASRRHRDRDAIGRVTAEVLTRASNNEVEDNGLARVMEQVVLDLLLPGRGAPWIRYEADKTADGATVNQRTMVDHVNFRDFVHSPARTWADVERSGWVARRVTMNKKEGRKRFGARFAHVEMTLHSRGGRPSSDHRESGAEPMFAEVWEVWDKASRKQLFIAKGVPMGPGGSKNGDGVLETRDDPYQLKGFFPCPRPVYSTLSNEDLVPTADYEQYRDQAEELDRISIAHSPADGFAQAGGRLRLERRGLGRTAVG